MEDVLRERGIQLELEDLDPRDPRNLGKAAGWNMFCWRKFMYFFLKGRFVFFEKRNLNLT